ncbi:hypothetical protein Sinac_3342 [Singulisphaera acidiphila DSM 18658]|uniref:Uncharacterized protein n=1 Tax=Singulisphaera acidiphila (strain ATCC BAA-1392 / DSM 18658 / VKM B-2454 / MOB10) TaxID=886293 RepID=L0DDZ9_SINAD|nr:hypothetical protein Sinac_3342 [Singulisphaera acidiphila DSM 18658]
MVGDGTDWRFKTSFRRPNLPQVGQGAFLGQHEIGTVRVGGRWVSMACVLQKDWL